MDSEEFFRRIMWALLFSMFGLWLAIIYVGIQGFGAWAIGISLALLLLYKLYSEGII